MKYIVTRTKNGKTDYLLISRFEEKYIKDKSQATVLRKDVAEGWIRAHTETYKDCLYTFNYETIPN